jgi:hypothetical protein
MVPAHAICMRAAYILTRCPSRRIETLMVGLLVLVLALMAVP